MHPTAQQNMHNEESIAIAAQPSAAGALPIERGSESGPRAGPFRKYANRRKKYERNVEYGVYWRVMKNTKIISPVAVTCLAVALAASVGVAGGRTITDFTPGETKELGWRVVNDGVMGGLSKGKIEISNKGVLNFSGKLSLENNGGFSSIRTSDLDLDLSDAEGLSARVRGDGRSYQVRLGSDARYRGMEVSFMAEFPTTKGEWTEVNVPFSELVGSFRGMKLKNARFDSSKVRRLGLLLADKNAGPFELEVDWIRTYADQPATVVDKAIADGRFGTLAAALTEAGLAGALKGEGPFTVFAPTDEAFAKLPKGTVENLLKPESRQQLQAVLKYHVVEGSVKLATALEVGAATTLQGGNLSIGFRDGRVRVGDATVLNADVTAANGVIHVIDSVLLPPPTESSTDIIGVAKKAGSFKTLLAAAEAAGLIETLRGEGPLTILAPTDDAFAKLPKGTVESLLKEENLDQLRAILTFHAISGAISAGDALNSGSARTVNGGEVAFSIKDGLLQVNGATIRTAGIEADNGIIHVIDTVLIPSSDGAKPESAQAECTPSMTPIARIEDAIDRGVPVFNGGDHGGCAAIYRECIQILADDEQVNPSVRKAMKGLLEQASERGSDTDRAWLYRRTLDHVHSMISSNRS
jgi:uncharacterized surface protein with fasciclin (FAS1) repeats